MTSNTFDSTAIAQQLDAAIAAHGAGRLDEAETAYTHILSQQPAQAEALHFLGILRHQQGRSDEGIALLRQSIALQPNAPGYNDLGNILSQRGDCEAAGQAFLTAIELTPTDPNYWNNLGSMLQRLGNLTDAEEAYRGALTAQPTFIPALHNLGELHSAQGNKELAAEYYCRAYILPPLENKPLDMLGIAHYQLGNIDQAAEAYRQWLQAEPDNPRAQHMYAACLGGQGPTRASDAYVEQTFDAYADSFDSRLISSLNYRGPQMIERAMQDIATPGKQLDILDGGCGTGLCGPLLATFAQHLSGVDLSTKMLNKARALGCYDTLEKAELTDYLTAHLGSYDLIAMADTIIYFGDTHSLFAATRQALRPNGWIVFTLETLEGSSEAAYQINPSGRYSHAFHYLQAILSQHGFALGKHYQDTLRTEFGHPVPGMVIAAQLIA